MTLINTMPSALVFAYTQPGFTQVRVQASVGMDTDITHIGVWCRKSTDNKSTASFTKHSYTSGVLSVTGLLPATSYIVSAGFLDAFISADASLIQAQYLQAANTINLTDVSLQTLIAPQITSAVYTPGAAEIGSPVSRVDITLSGSPQTVLIEASDTATPGVYKTVYSGVLSPTVSINLLPATYTLRVSGSVVFSDGTKENSAYHVFPSNVTVGNSVTPSAPTSSSVIAYKVSGANTFYELDVDWAYSEATGGIKRNFSITLVDNPTGAAASTLSEAVWSTGRLEVSIGNQITISPVGYRRSLALRINTAGWGDASSSYIYRNIYITSDTTESGILGYLVPTVRSAKSNTKVQVDDSGIRGYSVYNLETPSLTKSSFYFDATTGNVVLGQAETVTYPGGSVSTAPLIFDASTKRLQIDGHVITNKITAASYVMGWIAGSAPSFRTANKTAYGDSNPGIWMGYTNAASTDFKVDIGSPSQYIRWDGSTLRISGSVVIDGGGSLLQTQKIVFIYLRSASAPATPTGGTYASPVPAGWSLTIPAGADPVYQTSRTFTSDGLAPQDSTWLAPQLMATNGSSSSSLTLTSTSQLFTFNGAGSLDPATQTVVFSVNRQNISGGTTWSALGNGTTSITLANRTDTSSELTSGLFGSFDYVTVTATAGGYSDTLRVVRVQDGTSGTSGSRGAGRYTTSYAGTWPGAFNDTLAVAAAAATVGGVPVAMDVVTVYSSANPASQFTMMYNSGAPGSASNWTPFALMVNGNVLVDGTVSASKIDVDDLFAQNVTATGFIRVGQLSGSHVQLGGGSHIFAQNSAGEVVFQVQESGAGFINGTALANGSVGKNALNSEVIDYIRSQLVIAAPTTGGTVSGSQAVTTSTTTSTASSLTSDGSTVTLTASYGGGAGYIVSGNNPGPAPTINLSIRRNGVQITSASYTGTIRRGMSVAEQAGPWEYDYVLPSINWSGTDVSPGTGAVVYSVVMTINNYLPGDFSGTLRNSAAQSATGGGSTSTAWESITGKPNLSLVGHTHSAADITSGLLDDARLPWSLSQKRIVRAANATGANDYHFELNAPGSGGGGDIALRFHQDGYWYHSIRANAQGFRLTNGGNNTLSSLFAASVTYGDAAYTQLGTSNSVRAGNSLGHVDIGPQNSSYCHFYTTMPLFYMNKALQVDGPISVFSSSQGIDSSGHYGNGSRLTAVTATTFTTTQGNYKGVTDNSVAGLLMWKNYGNGHVIFDASSGVSPSGTTVNNQNPSNPWSGTYPTLMGWNGASTYGVRVDSAKTADSAGNAVTLGGYSTDNYLRFIGWSPRDANTQPNLDANFTYALNAPYAGPLIKFGPAGYELQLNANYGSGTSMAFRVANGDNSTWGSWRALAAYEPSNGYLMLPNWLRVAPSAGIYWENGTHLVSQTSGQLRVYGGAGSTSIILATSGNVLNGYVYADYLNQIGFLNQFGNWSLRVDSGSNAHASDFISTSDIRVKSDLEVIDGALTKLESLTGYTYVKKGHERRQAGYIAQDLESVLPEGVYEYEGLKQVSNGAVIALLIEAVKELTNQVKELRGDK